MNITWRKEIDKMSNIFRVKIEKQTKVVWEGSRVDLIFGSNSQLEQLQKFMHVMTLNQKFIKDFLYPSKVMNLDKLKKIN